MKTKINLIGGGFQHAFGSSNWYVPKYVEWDKTGGANISIYVDEAMQFITDKTKKNYAWFLESSAIRSNVFQWIQKNMSQLENNFELIFTCDKRLISLSSKFKYVLPPAVPWIINRGIHSKTKIVSMIASTKKMCPGHIYRQEILQKYKNRIDCFGVGHNPIKEKEWGLNNYCFSIAMQNDNYPIYFTEELTDCFATGTIPIFWGTSAVNEFFNENGIIYFNDEFKIENLSMDLYYSKMEFIKDNFERVNNLPMAEDYMFDKYLK
jgi:hypothetical protein